METKKQRLDVSNPEHIMYAHEAIEITVLGGLRLEGLDPKTGAEVTSVP